MEEKRFGQQRPGCALIRLLMTVYRSVFEAGAEI
jgi:hypothetical protein